MTDDMYFALVVFCVCISYLVGSINSAVILSRFSGRDIRNSGSGNAGATNVLRVMGKGAALAVAVFDAFKGVAAVLFAKYAPQLFSVPDPMQKAMYLSALAVVLGHVYPIYFGFRGGKGIMTSIAVVFVLDWEIGAILLVTCLIIMAATKYVSLGSCVGAAMLPILVTMFHGDNSLFVFVSLAIGILALYKHRTNISRLVHGCESKINFSG